MKGTETPPSAHVRKWQPEEFDLAILGGSTGSTVAAWTLPARQARRSGRSQVYWRLLP
jgi:hypothetical protein